MADTHLKLTVDGTTYGLVVVPETYRETDVVDFAPRATSASPLFAELGIYLDVAQPGWGHGYGQERYSEPESYACTGHLVDTSQGVITLYTNPVTLRSNDTDYGIHQIIWRNGIPLFLAYGRLYTYFNSNWIELTTSVHAWQCLDVGQYLLLSDVNRLKVADLCTATNITTSVIGSTECDWDATIDCFVGGTVIIAQPNGTMYSRTVTDQTAVNLTFTPVIDPAPTTGSMFFVYNNTGSGVNIPKFKHMIKFGGYMWGTETPWGRPKGGRPLLHYWADAEGAEAEGGTADGLAVYVGPGHKFLVNLCVFEGNLWAFRTDGAWQIRFDGTTPIAYHVLDFSTEDHADNFHCVCVWNGFMIFNIRDRIYKYHAGLQDITPPEYDQSPPTYRSFGRVGALLPRGPYLYAAMLSNAESGDITDEEDYVYAALMKTDGVGWHKVLDMSLTGELVAYGYTYGKSPGLAIDPVNDRLYYTYYDGAITTKAIKYVSLNPYDERPYASFPTTGEHILWTSFYDLGMRQVNKHWKQFTLHGYFDETATCEVAFRIGEGEPWIELGTWAVSGEVKDFPLNTAAEQIQFQFNLQSTSASSTPVIEYAVVKVLMRPVTRYAIYADIHVSDNLQRVTGTLLGLQASQIRTALKTARASVAPFVLEDIHGTSSYAHIASLNFTVFRYENENNIQEIARTTFVISDDAADLDDGATAMHIALPAAITPDLSAEVATGTLLVGKWYKITATEANHFYTGCAINHTFRAAATTALDANNKVKILHPLNATLGTVYSALTDYTAEVGLTLTGYRQAGLMLSIDDDTLSIPLNFLLAYHNGIGNAVLVKYVAGVVTQLISEAVAYGAGKILAVIKDGTSVSLYYDGAQVGTTQTVSDVSIISNTRHSWWSTDSTNTFVDFVLDW